MRFFARYVIAAVFLAAGITTAALFARAGKIAYVPLGSDNKLVLIDTGTDKVISTIEGLPAVHGLARTPDGQFLIAGSYEGREPGGITPPKPSGMSKDEHAAHHKPSKNASATKSSELSTLTIIRTADRTIVRKIDVPGAVHHVAVSPDGRFAVVTHPGEDRISAVDLKSYLVVANLSTGPFPNYAVFSPDGKNVYVSNAGNNTVSSVDATRWIVRWNAIVGASPEHVVFSKDGAQLFVNNVDDGSISIVDIAQRKSVRTVPVGETLHGIDLSEDGKALFVAVRGGNKVVAINLATDQSRLLTLSPSPYHLTVIRGLGKIYVSSAEEPNIWVVDQATLKVTGEILIGGKGHQIVLAPGG